MKRNLSATAVLFGALLLNMAVKADDSKNAKAITLKVISVTCESGAPVHYQETLKVGDEFPVTPKDLEVWNKGLGFKSVVLMSSRTGRNIEYSSGQPPCPTGDIIVVVAVKKN